MAFENYLKATLLFIIGLIAIVALLPIMSAFLPFISESSGSTVALLCSAMILLIVVGLIYRYVSDSNPEIVRGGQA